MLKKCLTVLIYIFIEFVFKFFYTAITTKYIVIMSCIYFTKNKEKVMFVFSCSNVEFNGDGEIYDLLIYPLLTDLVNFLKY